MKGLLRAEIRRISSRRLVRLLMLLVMLGSMFGGTAALLSSDDSAGAIADARARHRDDIARCVTAIRTGVEASPPELTQDPQAFCEEEVWYEDPGFRFAELRWIVGSLAMPLIVLGWLVGASFMGAEWANRTLMMTLISEPRRARVFVAKASVLVGAIVLGASLLVAFFTAAMVPAAVFEGSFAGVDASWWGSYLWLVLRIVLVCAAAGLFGFGLATIGRNTAAAMGAGFVYLAVVETLVRVFRPSWADWLIGDNMSLFLLGAADVNHIDHTQMGAGLLVLVYVVGLSVVAGLWFRRREIA